MDDLAEYTEWQRPLSGVYSIMMKKSPPPPLGLVGGGGGCTPTPFHYTVATIMSKVVVYALAERAETLPLFILYPYMYSVKDLDTRGQ